MIFFFYPTFKKTVFILSNAQVTFARALARYEKIGRRGGCLDNSRHGKNPQMIYAVVMVRFLGESYRPGNSANKSEKHLEVIYRCPWSICRLSPDAWQLNWRWPAHWWKSDRWPADALQMPCRYLKVPEDIRLVPNKSYTLCQWVKRCTSDAPAPSRFFLLTGQAPFPHSGEMWLRHKTELLNMSIMPVCKSCKRASRYKFYFKTFKSWLRIWIDNAETTK